MYLFAEKQAQANYVTKEREASASALKVTKDAEAHYFALKQDQSVAVLQKLMGRYQVVDMGIEEPSLENVIKRLYGEKA